MNLLSAITSYWQRIITVGTSTMAPGNSSAQEPAGPWTPRKTMLPLIGGLVLAGTLSWISPVEAACTSGASPTWQATLANLQSCHDQLSVVDGDTINVSAGTITLGVGQGYNFTKSISIVGAGIGQSIVIGNDNSRGYGTGLLWTTKNTGSSPAGFTRLSGFTFQGTAGAAGSGYAGGSIVAIAGTSKNVRVDKVRIEITTTSGLSTHGSVSGVFDHGELVNVSAALAHQVIAQHDNWLGTDNAGNGDGSWAAPSTLWTLDNFIFEDNTIQNSLGDFGWYCTDDHVGSRTIYRFNRLIDCTLQLHGTETSGRTRGGRYIGDYRNVFSWSFTAADPNGFNFPGQVANRGGGGLHFDNVATGNLQHFVDFSTLRYNDPFDTNGHRGSYPFGRCGKKTIISITHVGNIATATLAAGDPYSDPGGSYEVIAGATGADATLYNGIHVTKPVCTANCGTGSDVYSNSQITYTMSGTPAANAVGTFSMTSPFDSNADGTGYRCLDQAGAGQTIMLNGTGPACNCPALTPDPSTLTNGVQAALEPILTFNNTLNGVLSPMVNTAGAIAVINRDYYDQDASCTGSSCTSGIGRGTILPTACTQTVPGDSGSGPWFWKTNEGTWNAPGVNGLQDTADANGVMYRCDNTNHFSLFASPATYPHPLTQLGGGGPVLAPPLAPTGFSVK